MELGAISPSHVLICSVSFFRLSDLAGRGEIGLLRGWLEAAAEFCQGVAGRRDLFLCSTAWDLSVLIIIG